MICQLVPLDWCQQNDNSKLTRSIASLQSCCKASYTRTTFIDKLTFFLDKCTYCKVIMLAFEKVYLLRKKIDTLQWLLVCTGRQGKLDKFFFTHQQIKFIKSELVNENLLLCNRLKTCQGTTRQRKLVVHTQVMSIWALSMTLIKEKLLVCNRLNDRLNGNSLCNQFSLVIYWRPVDLNVEFSRLWVLPRHLRFLPNVVIDKNHKKKCTDVPSLVLKVCSRASFIEWEYWSLWVN